MKHISPTFMYSVYHTSAEVKHAIKKLNNNKATGTDLIAAEMLKALDDGPIEKLTQLCNEIYNTGYWPKDLKESIFIPIPKKPKATRCQDFRTISIMSQVTKLLLKIVMDRMKRKIETELDDAQSGFRQGRGTREGLLNLRLICERHFGGTKICIHLFLRLRKSIR